MARPRKTNRHLPPCVYPRHSAFWYVKGGKWLRLGAILQDALSEYARLHETPKRGMPALIDTVLLHLKPKLKPSTANQYATAARKLKTVLQHFAPEQVKPKHMAAIKVALPATPNMGNRCLSFLRQIFDYALEQQLVESNPALGIKRHHEKKRARLISADECRAIYATAGPRLQVIMELLIRTRQRVTAVLRIHRTDLGDDGIRFPAHKTDAKRIVRWTFELPEVVARAKGLNGIIRSLTLLSNRRGKAPDYRSVQVQWGDGLHGSRRSRRTSARPARGSLHGDQAPGHQPHRSSRPQLTRDDRALPPGPGGAGRRRAELWLWTVQN